MPKGKKTCEKCGHQCGPRAYMCPECQHPFMFAPQSKEKKTTRMIRKFDWKELEKGDKIKATGGPYSVVDGEFIPMGCRGKFTVMGVDDNGIIAYGKRQQYLESVGKGTSYFQGQTDSKTVEENINKGMYKVGDVIQVQTKSGIKIVVYTGVTDPNTGMPFIMG